MATKRGTTVQYSLLSKGRLSFPIWSQYQDKKTLSSSGSSVTIQSQLFVFPYDHLWTNAIVIPITCLQSTLPTRCIICVRHALDQYVLCPHEHLKPGGFYPYQICSPPVPSRPDLTPQSGEVDSNSMVWPCTMGHCPHHKSLAMAWLPVLHLSPIAELLNNCIWKGPREPIPFALTIEVNSSWSLHLM